MSRPIVVKGAIFADDVIIYILPQRNEGVNPRRHFAVHKSKEHGRLFFSNFKLSRFQTQRNISHNKCQIIVLEIRK